MRKLQPNLPAIMTTATVLIGGLILSLFRDATGDETLYLRDAAVMAHCLSNGSWFGNEAVGTHGFLFKLPAALLIIVFGTSVFIATFTTVIMAAGACWLCFRVFRRLFDSDYWALAGVWIVATNYHFVLTTPTFLRDIPALFATLLFLDAIVHKRGKWTLGLLLLLTFDAKEHVFLGLLPGFMLWVALDEWMKRDRLAPLRAIFGVIARYVAGLLPSCIYLVLMLCTGLVPLNETTAVMLGMTDGTEYALKHFQPRIATHNLLEGGISIFQFPAVEGPIGYVVRGSNFALRYIGKLLYPRTFSLIAVPKVVVFPSVIMSLWMFRRRLPDRGAEWLGFCLLLWSYLAIYVLRASHGRYLLPVLPLLALFFIEFMRQTRRIPVFTGWVVFLTAGFVFLGMYFEAQYVWIKVAFNSAILAAMAASVIAWKLNPKAQGILAGCAPALIGMSAASAALAASLLLPGQIGNFLVLGYNRECAGIMAEFKAEDRIWVNNIGWGHLHYFYRREMPLDSDRHWNLKQWIPKKALLRGHSAGTHDFCWTNTVEFGKQVRDMGIQRVGLLTSRTARRAFYQQDRLGELKDADWLTLETARDFKNKTLYVFRVKEN